MKSWEEATFEVVDLDETNYGGKTVTSFDNIFMNDEGVWEGTFVRS